MTSAQVEGIVAKLARVRYGRLALSRIGRRWMGLNTHQNSFETIRAITAHTSAPITAQMIIPPMAPAGDPSRSMSGRLKSCGMDVSRRPFTRLERDAGPIACIPEPLPLINQKERSCADRRALAVADQRIKESLVQFTLSGGSAARRVYQLIEVHCYTNGGQILEEVISVTLAS
jgi:hypothetical protein